MNLLLTQNRGYEMWKTWKGPTMTCSAVFLCGPSMYCASRGDTERVSSIYHKELNKILNTPRNPKCPEKYRDFNIFTRSCTTVIRDGLRKCGFRKIKWIMPRDLFVNAAYHFLNAEKEGALRLKRFTMKQLKVAEAPHSRMTPLFNPTNRIRRLVTRSHFDRG